jgi:7-cyano-7-deazaguanine reductase
MKETRDKSPRVHEVPEGFSHWCYIFGIVADYTEEHARAGIRAALPSIECWPNQFAGYDITISMPEFTSICPKTGLPDFGTITIRYRPNNLCLELKSLKGYFQAYRNLGIFYENAVNRILQDVVAACQPISAKVTGEFNTRGGMRSVIEAEYSAPSTLSSNR